MVFIELNVSTSWCEDFKKFLSQRKINININHYVRLIGEGENGRIIGTTSGESVVKEHLDSFLKLANILLATFKKELRGKYSSRAIRNIDWNINLYAPTEEENQMYKVDHKTAVAILSSPVVKKFPLKYKTFTNKKGETGLVIMSHKNIDEVVNTIKVFLFFNGRKTLTTYDVKKMV
ncbi:MAG: hypothetical protein PHG49_03940 [Candidatus Pacebacteria bacterium]|nr:hypothetical protein [Candidatus Paceibacterota bacterium]